MEEGDADRYPYIPRAIKSLARLGMAPSPTRSMFASMEVVVPANYFTLMAGMLSTVDQA